MSTTALDIIQTKRIKPLMENELAFKQPQNTNSYEISVLLATLRPVMARKCVESIAEASEGVNYEVVVVSPLDMCNLLAGCNGYYRLKYVKEEKREGCNKAFTTAYENASGKYVFAIADDHRLGQGCLRNLIEFMKPHDHEIFLAGTRSYGVYGAGPECKTYGFYYAFTPCIRRDLVDQVGGFFDTYYKSYYGDPDLSMRVWHHGGKVELCRDAWVEYHNESDDIDLEAHTNNAERDFKAFFKRWHPIYGHLVKSSSEKDINRCNDYVLPGIPPEKCTRLVVFLRQNDWASLLSELESKNNIRLSKEHLLPVIKEIMFSASFVPINIIHRLSKWLLAQLGDFSTQIENETGQREDQIRLVVFGYRKYNIVRCKGVYYGWPWYAGKFSLERYWSGGVPASVAGKSLLDVKNLIDEKLGPPTPEELNQHDWIAEEKM